MRGDSTSILCLCCGFEFAVARIAPLAAAAAVATVNGWSVSDHHTLCPSCATAFSAIQQNVLDEDADCPSKVGQ